MNSKPSATLPAALLGLAVLLPAVASATGSIRQPIEAADAPAPERAEPDVFLDCKTYPLTPRKTGQNWCAKAYQGTVSIVGARTSPTIKSEVAFSRGTRRIPHEPEAEQVGILGTVDARDRKLFRSWPMKVIPYWIDTDPNAKQLPEKSMVENALCQWQHTTPVRFRASKTTDPDKHILRFFSDNTSKEAKTRGVQRKYLEECLAFGRGTNYRTTIVMGWCDNPKDEREKGSVTHEVGHTLALSHEHLQEGRDDYLYIDFEMLEAAYKAEGDKKNDLIKQFYIDFKGKTLGQKYPADSDYDFASIMHYPTTRKYLKLKTDPKTIKPIEAVQKLLDKESIAADQVGQRACVSEGDAAAIIKLYENKSDTPP